MYCGGPSRQVKPHAKRGLESPKMRDFWGYLKFYKAIQIVNIGSESEEKTNRCSFLPFVDTLDSIKEIKILPQVEVKLLVGV